MSTPEKVVRLRVERMPADVAEILPVLQFALNLKEEDTNGVALAVVSNWGPILTQELDGGALLTRYERVIKLKAVFHKLAKVMKSSLENRPDINLGSLKKKRRTEAKDNTDLEKARKALADELEGLKSEARKKKRKQKMQEEVAATVE